ncbi:MAG: glycosyltransferase family 2 protein [Candidatus Taylorbacteria bacterium]|nr:glycosyltransferase family 2 protein [Candidatus Taylorbacteria bacterium]
MPKKILSIVIPMFNEAKTIGDVLRRLFALSISGYEIEIIVVDDGSTDDTKKILVPYLNKIKYLEHTKNLGKGSALRTAFANLHAQSELTIVQDADLEYSPEEISTLVSCIDGAHLYSAVYGSRNISRTACLRRRARGYSHYVLGAWLLTSITNLFFHSKLTDSYTCYKLIRTPLLKSLNLQSSGFEIEMEITAKLLKSGTKIAEVPISYHPRSFKEGKKIRARDALKGFITLIVIVLGRK